MQGVVFFAMIVTAFVGLVYGWKRWLGEAHKAELPMWRRISASLGLLAVTAQALLFLALWIWPGIGRNHVLFRQWARAELLLFAIALPLVLTAKGRTRRWLVVACVLLFVICFFITLTP